MVSTLAGATTSGYVDGPAASARFDTPLDLVVLADGTVFITDRYNRRIRKLSGGQVTSFAGNSNSGVVDANGANAWFKSPNRIVADGTGNLFSIDWEDMRVRKTSPTADVTTFAGVDITGHLDGPALSARFNESWGIAVDASGNVFIADTYNHRIRKISGGQVTTVAGNGNPGFANGNGTAAQFYFPEGIVVDGQGNLFVADRANNRIRKITPSGEVTTFSGSGTQAVQDGDATQARFNRPTDLARDSKGNLYVVDVNLIRMISPEGKVTSIAGNTAQGHVDGKGVDARFHLNFGGLAIDKDDNIFVADDGNNCIRKITITTE